MISHLIYTMPLKEITHISLKIKNQNEAIFSCILKLIYPPWTKKWPHLSELWIPKVDVRFYAVITFSDAIAATILPLIRKQIRLSLPRSRRRKEDGEGERGREKQPPQDISRTDFGAVIRRQERNADDSTLGKV